MSKFVKDSKALNSAMEASPSSTALNPKDFTKEMIDKRKGTSELQGTSEINSDWIARMHRAGQSDDDEESYVDAPGERDVVVKKANVQPGKSLTMYAGKGSNLPLSKFGKGKGDSSRRVTGISSHELKAIEDYESRGDRSNEQLEAFVEGYRVRQDYAMVALQAQILQMGKLIDSLTSATTSISRASSDLVDSTNHSTSKLATAVTGYIEYKKGGSSGVESSKPPLSKDGKNKGALVQGDSSDPASVTKEAEESNRKESERIRAVVSPVAKKQVAVAAVAVPAAPKEKIPLTKVELSKVMGMSVDDIMTGYKLESADLDTVLAATEGPLSHYLDVCSGARGAKGHVKKIISMVKGAK